MNSLPPYLINVTDGAIPLLKQREIIKGYTLIIGDESWFNKKEWKDYVISVKGKYVKLVFLYANNKYNGALKRLINNILEAHLLPVIVDPLPDMAKIILKWSWSFHETGFTNNLREQCYIPSQRYLDNRLMQRLFGNNKL